MTPGDVAALLVSPGAPALELVELGEDARHYARAARSPATWRAYGVAWRAWASYSAARNVAPLPAAAGDVADYLAGRARAGASSSTLAHALQTLALAHRLIGLEPPGRSPIVRAVLAGIRREHGTAPTSAGALRLADLRALLEVLEHDEGPKAIRDRAILLVAWCGALRRSEVVALERADLAWQPEGVAVNIRRSKTDVAGAGELIGLPRGRRPTLCPVRALDAWIAVLDRERIPTGAVFRRVSRWGAIGDRLGDRAIAIVVDELGQRAGYPPGSWSGHSFRSGFATEAAANGVPEREIARQTRHRSMAVLRRYIHAGGLFVDHPASRLV